MLSSPSKLLNNAVSPCILPIVTPVVGTPKTRRTQLRCRCSATPLGFGPPATPGGALRHESCFELCYSSQVFSFLCCRYLESQAGTASNPGLAREGRSGKLECSGFGILRRHRLGGDCKIEHMYATKAGCLQWLKLSTQLAKSVTAVVCTATFLLSANQNIQIL
jgi:hypothetical protein